MQVGKDFGKHFRDPVGDKIMRKHITSCSERKYTPIK